MWRPARESEIYGVAIYNYLEDGPHRMKLHVGDVVHITEECDDWFRGCQIRDKKIKGIFPRSFVHIKDAWIDNSGPYEALFPKEPPIVHEITSVLREWGAILRDLYMSSNTEFAFVKKMMQELIDWRKQIMSRKLTVDELKELKQKVTAKIDMGNAMLGLDLIVRDEFGDTLNPDRTGTVKLFRQHEIATERIKREKSKVLTQDQESRNTKQQFSLLVHVKNFVCRIGEDADVLMTLYDGKEGKFFSESYIMKWGNQGMPKDLEMLHNLRVLFTDLGSIDLSRDKVCLVCQIIRIGAMDMKEGDSKKQTHGLRRPFGVAAMDLADYLKGTVQDNDEKQHFIPFQTCGERDFMDTVIKKTIQAKDINHKGQGLWISLKTLPGDLKQVKQDFPHLVLGNTAIARKMGFPEVILPSDVRNDIYVTIMQGEFSRGTKTSDKNVEVSMCVCNERGQVLQNCISTGAGGEMGSYYKSVIYYHEDKPKWFETVKVAIPIEDFYGSHLKFMLKHRSTSEAKDKSERERISFIKLMNDDGTTLADRVYDLCVYKVDTKKQDKPVYLTLPSTRQDLEKRAQPGVPIHKQPIQAGPLILSHKDAFQISTLVCSTKLTHNVDLMGLLKWRDNPDGLKDHLTSLMKVDGEEVVKFLQDTLDALFNILMQNSDSDLYDNLVFDALIFIISLISDRKYHQFKAVLEVYIEENFSATLAYNKLMVVLKYYIDTALERNQRESLLKAMKSLEYVFKFIIRSRLLFAELNEGRGQQQFSVSVKQLFQAINNMMKSMADNTVLVQGAALKYLPSAVSDIIAVFDPQELSHLLVEFINNVPKERLTKQKMHCIREIIHSKIFKRAECRHVLLPMILNHVKLLLNRGDELQECCRILSDIMELLTLPKEQVGSVTNDISTIVLSSLRTVIQTVIPMPRDGPNTGSFVALLTAMLRQMTEFHYSQYINHFQTTIDLTDFLMEILMVFRDLVSKNVYQSDWNEMIMLQNSVILKALRCFSHTIRDRFSKPFEYQLWNNFFHCAISFLTQDSLQLENFSAAKRNKIVQRYKDMRRETGFEIRSLWFNLGQHKIKFIPEIVGPFLEMTLIPETELRKATIPIFFDMMQCEFTQTGSTGRVKGSFPLVENEIITQLDALVEGGRGDEQYKDLFFQIMYGLCEGHSTMKEQGLCFVEMVQKLLQRLLEYRTIIHDESKENRMSCTVNLLNFYHDISRQEMYIRYLHKLCDLHLECDNYTEAAYTLMLYAKLLQWSDEALPQMLQSDKYPKAKTHRSLKQKLYSEAIGYFDKGKMWEKGIELCKEKADQYENETFDYLQLAKILQQQSDFYTRIMKQTRPEPEYFRVGYYGKGFPSFLQNKVFIFRGNEYERLPDFSARLQNQFPNASLLRTLTPPGEDITESNKEYLQINAVTPILEPQERFQNKKVRDQILKYYRVNEVQKFTFSRRLEDSGNEITKMWLERTNLVTSYPLPGILRWFPVASTDIYQVSPLENAIETVEAANHKLKTLTEQHASDASLRIDPLSMVINGVVDASVNGGITEYKVFYSEDFTKANPKQKTFELVCKLKDCTLEQVSLLESAIKVHAKKAPESLKPFHAHMETRFEELKQLLDKELGIKVSPTKQKSKVKRVMTMPPQPTSTGTLSLIMPEPRKQRRAVSPNLGQQRRSRSPYASPDSIRPTTVMASTPPRQTQSASPSRVMSAAFKTSSPALAKTPNSKTRSVISTKSEGSNTSSSPIIELNEQLTPLRPPRPGSGDSKPNSRPSSGVIKMNGGKSMSIVSISSDSSMSTPTSSIVGPDYDEPPPLPQKQAYADYTNMEEDQPPLARKSTLQHTHRDKPQPPLPVPKNPLPPTPPKKPSLRPPSNNNTPKS